MQTSSRNASEPNAKIGTGQRFGQYKTTFKNDFDVPAASSWTPSSGWIGDAPTFTFHGKGKRADIAKGLPGFKPTPGDTPGPGSYEAQPAFGPQVRLPACLPATIGRLLCLRQCMCMWHP